MSDLPAVSLVVLNFNGRLHLEACLPSLEALDYPRDRLEIIVCDNGSEDGSVAYVKAAFPAMRVVELDRNYGFAEGNNRAVQHASHPWLAFLNNDMWVEPLWLRNLVEPLAGQPRLTCVGSRILNWDGTAIDFIGAGMNFEGHGFQIDLGRRGSPQDVPRRLLSASGGAMLIRSDVYREFGGFDADYFGLFEDEDLGWRMNLLGHDVWYEPRATVYHRLHGTIKRLPSHRVRVLYERNALFTIYKCLEQANLNAVLPAAMLLINERAMGVSDVNPRHFELPTGRPGIKWAGPVNGAKGGAAGESTASLLQKARRVLREKGARTVLSKGSTYVLKRADAVSNRARRRLFPGSLLLPTATVSGFIALSDFGHALEALRAKREWVQARRVRSDRELVPLFVDALRPSWNDPTYERFFRHLASVLGIDQRFALRR